MDTPLWILIGIFALAIIVCYCGSRDHYTDPPWYPVCNCGKDSSCYCGDLNYCCIDRQTGDGVCIPNETACFAE